MLMEKKIKYGGGSESKGNEWSGSCFEFLFLKSAKINFDDTSLADNRISVDIWQANDISILNSKIIGYSFSFIGAVTGVKDTEMYCKV